MDYILELENEEHGTHVAGTVAGKSTCANDYLNQMKGVAPESKIAYIGHFNENLGGDINGINKLMAYLKSYISTNSWGTNGYSPLMNWLYGQIYNIPDILFIFAATNSRKPSQIYFTIGDPGGNKNVLTVGALDPLNDMKKGNFVLKDIDDFVQSTNVPNINCHFSNVNNYDTFYSSDYNLLDQYDKNVDLGLLLHQIRSNQTVKYKSSKYSSVGPGNKGILKPDVVAPGSEIVSAYSSSYLENPTAHGCLNTLGENFISMNGTSMATPNVAGAASLIRQYFKEERNIILNGYQLRSLIIASASKPDESKSPDMFIGHGIVDLSTILSFANEFGVALSDKNSKFKNANHKVAKVEVINKHSPLRIVLSYLDIELNLESIIPIFIDLDLVVVSPSSKKRFLGDYRDDNDAEHFSTNEKVIVNKKELEIGEYEIHVYSNMDLPVLFSVVAVGPVENQQLTFVNTLNCGCNECTEMENVNVIHLILEITVR